MTYYLTEKLGLFGGLDFISGNTWYDGGSGNSISGGQPVRMTNLKGGLKYRFMKDSD